MNDTHGAASANEVVMGDITNDERHVNATSLQTSSDNVNVLIAEAVQSGAEAADSECPDLTNVATTISNLC